LGVEKNLEVLAELTISILTRNKKKLILIYPVDEKEIQKIFGKRWKIKKIKLSQFLPQLFSEESKPMDWWLQ